MKDHSKTGKDEHLGSFAARINDMQEGKHENFPVSSSNLQFNFFSGYRRVFLSDYSGREMRPASLFLKVSKKWDAQWDRSPNLDPCLTNPRDVKPSETKVLRIHPFCYLIQIQRIWIPSIIYLLKKRKLLPATSDLLILAVTTYWLQWISSFDIYPYYFLARIKSAVIKKRHHKVPCWPPHTIFKPCF